MRRKKTTPRHPPPGRETPLIAPRQYTRHPHESDGHDVVTWRCTCWKTHQIVEPTPASSKKGRIATKFTCSECHQEVECKYYDQTKDYETN